ncbi:MAG: citramalate synthase, partial [Candidatus Omnitrophica bacterium]|nr:citramalate synthase [Candidatus Omnitrophota bacterium]
AGAEAIILCDTNGGTMTSEIFKIVQEVKELVNVPVGIHCHNDSDMAVANSLAAVQAGAAHVQGTINGIGERCGNANLISVIADLVLKLDVECISRLNLKELTEASRYVAEICNMRQLESQPFVGNSAFAHKAGVHINAIQKNPKTYEHVDPQLVGNRRRILVSELTGKSGFIQKAQEMELELDKNSPKTQKLLKMLQDLEHEGYHFEAAEASLELLMKRALKKFDDFFKLEDFRIVISKEGKKLTSEAIIKLKVGKHLEHTAALGDGPVNALDNALRKALKAFYPGLSEMHLSDFKVRVLDEKAGTAAKVRVLIQSQDKDASWWTMGVSENIMEASWQALVDSIEYKLLKDSKKDAK